MSNELEGTNSSIADPVLVGTTARAMASQAGNQNPRKAWKTSNAAAEYSLCKLSSPGNADTSHNRQRTVPLVLHVLPHFSTTAPTTTSGQSKSPALCQSGDLDKTEEIFPRLNRTHTRKSYGSQAERVSAA